MPDIFTDKKITPSDTPERAPVLKQVKKIPLNSLGMFTTFIRNPLGVALADQATDEQIILLVRRDFITNVPWIIITVILLLVPFFVNPVLTTTGFSFAFLSIRFVLILLAFYYLIVLGYVFANFITWFYGIGIVTQKRAIDIDLYNISYINVSAAALADLKDVSYFQRGFFQSFFDFGDVSLVVEAAGKVFIFEKTPRPAEVAGIISNVIGGHDGAD